MTTATRTPLRIVLVYVVIAVLFFACMLATFGGMWMEP